MQDFEVTVKKTFYDIDDVDQSIEYYGGMPVILDPLVMRDAYQADYVDQAYQIVFATGGNGLYPDHIGKGVFFMEADGQSNKWDRYSVLGVPTKETMKHYLANFGDYVKAPRIKEVFEAYANS